MNRSITSTDNPVREHTQSMDSHRVTGMVEQRMWEDVDELYKSFDAAKFRSLPHIRQKSAEDSLAKALDTVVESTPHMLWKEYDSYTDANKWSKLDQMRVISLDFMFRRYLSFHNNHQTHNLSTTTGYTKWLPKISEDLSISAFETQVFNSNKPYEPPKRTSFLTLANDLSALSTRADDFKWIHIHDLRCLDEISEVFSLHKYARRFFLDLRCHSSISAFQDGIFASIMTVRILCAQAKMYKIYFYSSEKFLLTFEREVIQDCSHKLMGKDVVIPYRDLTFSVLMSREILDENDEIVAQAVREELKTNDRKLLDALNIPTLQQGVVQAVMSKCAGEVYSSVCAGGGIFLFYEIMMQSLLASESVLEFMARSIDYFKSLVGSLHKITFCPLLKQCLLMFACMYCQTYKELSSETKRNFFRENATLKSCVRMMLAMVEDSLISLRSLMDKTTIEFDFVIKKLMHSWEATLCVAELEDSFRFRKLCLQAQLEECDVLSESLEHRMDLTSERHSMYLNLVATVFLPLTFFAGVFGMNFQVDGGYTMDILNKESGPTVFWLMCLACIIFNIVWFARHGMIEFFHYSGSILRAEPKDDTFERTVTKFKTCVQEGEFDEAIRENDVTTRRSAMSVASSSVVNHDRY